MIKSTGNLIGNSLDAILDEAAAEGGRFSKVLRRLAMHPIKLLAAFFFAPILITRIALTVEQPVRRWIAVFGLSAATCLSYVAGTALGTITGALFMASKFGILMGIGFLVGSTLSVFLSVAFCIIVFDTVAYAFLKMSSQEVIDYLAQISS